MAKARQQKKQEPAQETQKQGRSKRKIFLLSLLILFLLTGLAGLGYWGYQQFGPFQERADQPDDTEAAEAEPDRGRTELVSMPTMLVNLADPLGKRYLKVTMDLEVAGRNAPDTIRDNKSRLKDALILLFSSKSYAELSSMEQKMALKDEIISRLNQILGSSVVLDVYFTEFVIQ